MDNGWDQSSNLILALPPFTTLTNKKLKFYAYNNNGSFDLEVGTMSNPNDANTFVPMTNITTSTSYLEYEVSFDTYTGSDEYIAIRHGNGSSYLGFYIDDINIVNVSTISGNITYANEELTPLNGCSVELYDGSNQLLFSTTTNATGYYEFTGIIDGSYSLKTTCTLAHTGFNIADAFILRQSLTPGGPVLSPIQHLAADVTWDGFVNIADAFATHQELAGGSASWLAPDYVFLPQAVTVSGSAVSKSFEGLCSGDVNSSGVPVN